MIELSWTAKKGQNYHQTHDGLQYQLWLQICLQYLWRINNGNEYDDFVEGSLCLHLCCVSRLEVIKRQWQWQRQWQIQTQRQRQGWRWFRGRQYLLLCSVSPLGVIKRRPPPSLGSVKIGEVGVACSWWGGGPGWWGCCIPHIWHFTHPLHYLGVYTDNCMISRQNSQSWLK